MTTYLANLASQAINEDIAQRFHGCKHMLPLACGYILKTIPLEVTEYSTHVHCRSCLSHPWGELLAALAIEGYICLTHPWEGLLAALAT